MQQYNIASSRRRDHVRAAYVDAALKLSFTRGIASALKLLRHEGVPAEVVTRVFGDGKIRALASFRLNTAEIDELRSWLATRRP